MSREPRQTSAKPVRSGASGFTLLEVLAAVAVLGIWFTVLATVAIQGLRAEGESARLVRASLAADVALADIEAQIAAGEFPREEVEAEIDDFTLVVRSVPFVDTEFEVAEADLSGFIAENLATVNQDLYEIQVEIGWVEGVDERTLVRSTYAWDPTTFNEAIAAATPGTPEGEEGAAAEEEP